MTDDLAHAGWAQLQEIEREGGVVASIADDDGGLCRRIQEQAVAARRRQIATRRRPITGVSEFPNLGEELPDRKPWPEGALQVERYGAVFEAMRDEPATTPVLLATMGPIAQHTARATFAANLLAAGGVDTVGAGATKGPDDLVAALQEHPTTVVCLAGTDPTYAEWGRQAISALREAGATYVILAGKPGDNTVDGVDDSCAIGVDAVAFLGRVREELSR